ncbi:Uncharacterised protein [Streptococcus pneumoniae]|nr:Uncharacterised protein [Streptococcus pneumoniae]
MVNLTRVAVAGFQVSISSLLVWGMVPGMESGQPSGRTGEIIGTMPDLKHGTSILMGKCTVGMKSVFMIKWIFRIHREQTSMGILLFLVLLCFQMVSNLEVKMCLVMVGIPKAEGMRLFGGIRSVAVA